MTLLLVALVACATTAPPDPNLPAGVDAWPAVTKLAFFPVQVRVDVDRVPITPESLVAVQQTVQGALEGAVGDENLEARAFFSLSEPWQLGAVAIGHWLEATSCSGSGAAAPENAQLPGLLASVRADAAVFIDVHAELKRDAISSGHTVLGKLAGGLGVATVANVVALRAAASGAPYLQLAVETTAAQLVARDLEARRYGPLCADHVDLELRDEPGVRELGRAAVTIAVVAADNELLWFRRGRVPLLSGEPKKRAATVAELVRAGN